MKPLKNGDSRTSSGDPNKMKMLVNKSYGLLLMIYSLNFLLSLAIPYPHTALASDTNVCGYTNLLFCNCDDSNKASEATCYTLNSDIPDGEQWQLFKTQPNIQSLKISAYNNVGLKQFPSTVFRILKNTLKTVELVDLNLTTLPTRAFHDMPQLKNVEINLCPTIVIQENAFDDLVSLEKIVMASNNLTVLPRMFNKLPVLRELYLEDNGIKSFEDDVFVPLFNLTYLTLDKNIIEVIQSKNFNGLVNLFALDIRLNRISHLPARVFEKMPNLGRLDLSYNKIETIHDDAFVGLNKLQELRLEYNSLTVLANQIKKLDSLIEVNLSHNRLQTISKISFHRPDQKRFVHLKIKNNTLYCDCHILWLRKAVESFSLDNYQIPRDMKCYLGNDQFQDLTVWEYLMSPNTTEQCNSPTFQFTTPNDEFETVPIETIDQLDSDTMENTREDLLKLSTENNQEKRKNSNEKEISTRKSVEQTNRSQMGIRIGNGVSSLHLINYGTLLLYVFLLFLATLPN